MNKATKISFDFDSPEHSYDKQPVCEAIPSPAGIWVAHENQQLARWQQGKEFIGALAHMVKTAKYDNQGKAVEIPGALFCQPKLLIIGRSPLLAGANRCVYKVWEEGDMEIGLKSARKYLLMFLNQQNQPLHIAPIELTAWSIFLLEFDKNVMAFRAALESAYASATGKLREKAPIWHSMGVFCPQFKTEVRGQSKETSLPCCITTEFAIPTAENWETLYVGRMAIASEIAALHHSTSDWWERRIQEELAHEANDDFDEEDFQR